MRRLIPLAFVALLALAGCQTAGAILTGSTANPITPRAALQLHSAFYATVAVPAASYNRLPRCSHAPAPCSEQAVVKTLRKYVNSANATLKLLDQWALGNTSLNGPALYQAATIAISTAQAFNLANGVK